MKRVEILVKIGSREFFLDTDQDIGMPINYLISDINNISTTKASYTKTIKIPETDNNNYIFGYISDLSSDGSLFDPNLRTKAYILVDSIIVVEGYLQFKKVNIQTSNTTYYDCVIYGDNFNFFNSILDKFITDINFSEYDHVFNKNTIVNSWTANSDRGYFYGLMDVGSNWEYKDINGTSYSVQADRRPGRIEIFYNELKNKDYKASIYVKTIIDKIFNNAGFTYKSDFFNTQKFKNLLIPFNGSVMPTSNQFIYDNSFAVGRTNIAGPTLSSYSDTPLVSVNGNPQFSRFSHKIDFDNKITPYSDPLNAYQTGISATSSYWINRTGITLSTGFVVNLDIDAQWADQIPATNPPTNPNAFWYGRDNNTNLVGVLTYSLPAGQGFRDYQDYIQIFRSRDPITGDNDPNFDIDGMQKYACPIFNSSTKLDLWGSQVERENLGTFSDNGLTSSTTNFKLVRYTTDLLNGTTASQFLAARPNEKFKMVLTRVFGGGRTGVSNNGTTGFKSITALTLVKEGSYLALNIDRSVFTGASVDFNGILPKKYKQYDFITNIIKMFNLYIEPSKEVQNCLIIEPRDDYYSKGDIVDWRLKVDNSKEITETIVGETQKKYTNFTYKMDTDWYNNDYFQKTNNIFGEYDFISTNEFSNNSSKIELTFSPTPISNVADAPGIIIPKIYKVNSTNTGDSVARFDFNTRILTRSTAGTVSTGENVIRFEGTNYKYYPYMGHIDHPTNPTYDINFGEVTEIYNGGSFGWNRYTIPVVDDNLFNTYYSKMMYEYSNPASKIVSVYLNLDPIDIYKFRFNDNVFLNIKGVEQYYKILKIEGYDPTKNSTCRVELLKTFYITIPKNRNADTGNISQPNGIVDPNQTPPIYIPPFTPVLSGLIKGNNNNVRSNKTLVLGSDNNVGNGGIVLGNNSIISGSNVISTGDGNIIQDSNGVLSIGSGNTILNSSTSLVIGDSNTVESSSIVFGSGNSVPNGLNNTFVIGTNIVATEINTIYIGGTGSNIIINGTVSGLSYFEATYSDLVFNIIDNNGLVPGALYKITDRGDLGLFFIAISTNELSNIGTRLMLCPTDYDPGVYGGTYSKGIWYPGMTASANQLAIWGGQVWKNNAGVSGTASSIVALDSNWTLVDKTTFSNGEYEQKQFSIIYDFDNDWIQKQWDGYGNEVGVDNKDNTTFDIILGAYNIKYNPCDVTDWNLSKNLINYPSDGLTYSAMTNNICPFGIFNNVNLPSFSSDLITIQDNQCNTINSNRSKFIVHNHIAYDITRNTWGSIGYNTNNGSIIGNINFNSGNFITYNRNNGHIASNTTGNISDPIVDK